jgi:hypothetical protein
MRQSEVFIVFSYVVLAAEVFPVWSDQLRAAIFVVWGVFLAASGIAGVLEKILHALEKIEQNSRANGGK